MEQKVNPLVTFRELADGNVVALCGKHDEISVDVLKVDEYVSKMRELTGGTDVEFNDTFRQICKNRVFYAYEPMNAFSPDNTPHLPMVVECVLLSDDTVAMNINGKIEFCVAEDGNAMWETKEDAKYAAKAEAFALTSDYLDYLFGARAELKDILKSLNGHIDKALEFKNSL